jgi:CxxC-x17-CxxC domain-containing protein
MSQKRMFEVKCTDCGKSTTVPFEPTKGKPVYCRACFAKHRSNQPERSSSVKKRFDMKNAWAIRGDKWQGRKEVHHSVFKTA